MAKQLSLEYSVQIFDPSGRVAIGSLSFIDPGRIWSHFLSRPPSIKEREPVAILPSATDLDVATSTK